MPNELIWILFAIVNFTLLLLFYRYFGKVGLFVWIGMATILANIQVLKTIELFGLTATLGNIMYGTVFLATDILHEKYSKDEAKKGVWLGFMTLITMTIIMQTVLLFEPAIGDFAHPSLTLLFGLIPQITLGSLLAYLVSQYTDLYIFSRIKRRFPSDKFLWLRNMSTAFSQLIDTFVFCAIAFYGQFPLQIWIEIFITTYIIKFIVALFDTPFMYIAKYMKKTKL